MGETAIAIGNALGVGQTVTCGIISALEREVTTDAGTFTELQTTPLLISDAAAVLF